MHGKALSVFLWLWPTPVHFLSYYSPQQVSGHTSEQLPDNLRGFPAVLWTLSGSLRTQITRSPFPENSLRAGPWCGSMSVFWRVVAPSLYPSAAVEQKQFLGEMGEWGYHSELRYWQPLQQCPSEPLAFYLDMLLRAHKSLGSQVRGEGQNNDQDVVKLKGTLLMTSWYFVWFWTIVSGA